MPAGKSLTVSLLIIVSITWKSRLVMVHPSELFHFHIALVHSGKPWRKQKITHGCRNLETGYYKSFVLANIFVNPLDTGSKLKVHKTFRRRPGRLLNVLCTFNLRPVSRWKSIWNLKKLNWEKAMGWENIN